MPTIPTRLPTFDARRTPSDPASAGKQAAIDLWGVGKKTVERLKEKLRLDPTATPTVADFAYTNLDTFDVSARQRALLQEQQAVLVNELHIAPEDAKTAVAGELVAKLSGAIDAALEGIRKGEGPGGFVQSEITRFVDAVGMSYGIYGPVSAPSPEEIAKATALGLRLDEGQVPLMICREGETGAVVVPVRPRDLVEPVVVQMGDGKQMHSFTRSHARHPLPPGYVIEEPTNPFAKLKSLETQARDAAAAVWIDADPAGRRQRYERFTVAIDKLETAIDSASLGANHASALFGALQALRAIRDVTLKHLDA